MGMAVDTYHPIGDQRRNDIPKKDVYTEKYIDTIITIYDISGVVVKKYEGKYWIIDTSSQKVIFEDENKHRHIIQIATGSITIDQKG